MSSKLTDLVEITNPSLDDLIYLVDDPSGSPLSRKVTAQNLLNLATMDIGDIIGSGTPDCVLFIDDNSLLGQDTNFKWDATTGLNLGSKNLTTGNIYPSITNSLTFGTTLLYWLEIHSVGLYFEDARNNISATGVGSITMSGLSDLVFSAGLGNQIITITGAGQKITTNAGSFDFDDDNVITTGDMRIVSSASKLEIGPTAGGDLNLYNDAGGTANIAKITVGDLIISNTNQDSDIYLSVNDGGVTKSIIWDASEDLLQHTAGTFNFDNDNLTTTGIGTLGSLVVDTTTLVANATGYTDKIGFGTADPDNIWEFSDGTPTGTFAGIGMLLRNPTATDGTTTLLCTPALIQSTQGKGATNQQYQWAQVMFPSGSQDILTFRYYYKFGAGAWTVHPFYLDNANGFVVLGLANAEDPYKAPNTFNLLNSTAATSTVDQYSPPISWASQGWKTDGTAASQYMGLLQVNAPEKGVISPIGVHKWMYGINAYGNSTTETNELMRFQWGTDAGVTGVFFNKQDLASYTLALGGATTDLIGFYGVAPVDQPATVADPAGGLVVDTEARTAVNTIIDRLQELGLIGT